MGQTCHTRCREASGIASPFAMDCQKVIISCNDIYRNSYRLRKHHTLPKTGISRIPLHFFVKTSPKMSASIRRHVLSVSFHDTKSNVPFLPNNCFIMCLQFVRGRIRSSTGDGRRRRSALVRQMLFIGTNPYGKRECPGQDNAGRLRGDLCAPTVLKDLWMLYLERWG